MLNIIMLVLVLLVLMLMPTLTCVLYLRSYGFFFRRSPDDGAISFIPKQQQITLEPFIFHSQLLLFF